jgi:hypothetical protein
MQQARLVACRDRSYAIHDPFLSSYRMIGTAGGPPLRPLCSRLSEAIGKRATARAKYQATHIVRIKKDVLLRGKEEGLPP